jgi:hypothetical protein
MFYNIIAASSFHQEEGESFVVSVGAYVVSYYICKWLDKNKMTAIQKESPRAAALRDSLCEYKFSLYTLMFISHELWLHIFLFQPVPLS